MSDKTSWVQVMGIIISVSALTFTIYQYNESQEQLVNLGIVDQMQFFQAQFKENGETFIENTPPTKYNLEFIQSVLEGGTPEKINEFNRLYELCSGFSFNHLKTLDQLSFLKNHDMLNDEVIEYFNNEYHQGVVYYDWIDSNPQVDLRYDLLEFKKINATMNYPPIPMPMITPCNYIVFDDVK